MVTDQVAAFIKHHGVKGQKWGIRTKSSSHRGPSDDALNTPRGKHPTSLTDKQLQAAINRINLEQSYARLNPTKMERGRQRAAVTLATVGIGVSLYNLATSPAGKATIRVGKKALENLKYM